MRTILLAFIFAVSTSLIAQEADAPNNLSNQFNDLKTKSNNYQFYKVVKETTLDEFWKSVRDTLQSERASISSLRTEVSSLQKEVNSLNAQMSERDSKLEEQEHLIEHMNFLGVALTKGSYIMLTWILIIALLVAALVLYFRFNGANRITAQTRNEIQMLRDEFDTHRQRTRDNETKLKRDLQTEINKVEELKAQLDGNA